MIPLMEYKALQEGIFLWEFKLNQPYSEIMNMPFHKAKIKMEMFFKYQKEFGDSIAKALQGLKSKFRLK
jgi:hypothetical protein